MQQPTWREAAVALLPQIVARIELEAGLWHVRIMDNAQILAEHYFRRGCKRQALVWASEQIYLAVRGNNDRR